MTATPTPAGASLSDILTAAKNIVVAVNALTQTLTQLTGVSTTFNITSPTVVKTGTGRLCTLSIIAEGTTPGTIYDSKSLSTLTAPIFVIPTATGVTYPRIPVSNGIVVVPGTGQIVTVSYS